MDAAHLRDQFAATYLTLISVLEAVLLGLLVPMVDTKIETMGAENWLRVASSVTLTILVWNEYRMGVSQFVWIPGVVDSIVPFLIGGAQLAVIRFSFLDVGLWFGALAAFYLAGFPAYENMYRRSAAEGALNAGVLAALGRWRYVNSALCIAGAVLFGACAAITVLVHLPRGVRLAMLGAALAVNVAILFRGELNWRRVVTYALRQEARHTTDGDAEEFARRAQDRFSGAIAEGRRRRRR